MNTTLKAMAAAGLIFGASLATTVPAFAHAMPVETEPAFDSTLTAPFPKEMRIRFTEPVEIAFTKVVITDEAGSEVAVGPLALDAADPRIVIVPFAGELPAGKLTIAWSTVAVDTHKSNGTFHLNVAN